MSLTIANPYVLPVKSKEKLLEICYEFYNFSALYPTNSGSALSIHESRVASIVIDSSHSGTYVYPTLNGSLINQGVRRLDVGGKLLSKYLGKMVSQKQLKMDEFPQAVEKIKEKVTFISECPKFDFENFKDKKLLYVMPDPDIGREGYIAENIDDTGAIQTISLSTERFSVPEAIFNP